MTLTISSNNKRLIQNVTFLGCLSLLKGLMICCCVLRQTNLKMVLERFRNETVRKNNLSNLCPSKSIENLAVMWNKVSFLKCCFRFIHCFVMKILLDEENITGQVWCNLCGTAGGGKRLNLCSTSLHSLTPSLRKPSFRSLPDERMIIIHDATHSAGKIAWNA